MEGTAGVVDWSQCTADQPESHTYNPRAIAEVRLNGTVVGESGLIALVAQAYGVPVVLVTGEDVTAAEAEAVCPGNRTAVVKTAVSRFAADSLHPSVARDLIRGRAREAITGLADARPPSIELPPTLEVQFRNADLAEMATWISGVERAGQTVASMNGDDPVALCRRFVTTVLPTHDIAE